MTTNALNGKDLKLYVGNNASPEVYTIVAALQTFKMDMKRSSVDITNKDSSGWQEMLGTASIASAELTGTGVFSNAATQATIYSIFNTGASNVFKAVDGAGNTWIGSFIATAYSRSGGYNDADTLNFTLDSTGPIAFTAGS